MSTPGGKRQNLGEVLPLSTPFLIQIFPVYACNFKCSYCIFSLDKNRHGYISEKTFMDYDLYKKCIDDMKKFDTPLKMLRFAGIGEPLLHKDLPAMIKYASDARIAQSIDIVTNGAMLTKELSDNLLESGLNKLRISLEGLSSEQYYKNCGANIDFDNFLNQIEYFYANCKETRVYVKIIDYMLKDEHDQQRFYNIFETICHDIAIEHLTPTIDEIDYVALGGEDITKPQNGEVLINSNICPQPFYLMQINPDGKVVPCCSMKYPCVLGNTKIEGVKEIWLGDKFNKLRKRLLNGVKETNEVCSNCKLYIYGLSSEDKLDEYSTILKYKY